jgi:hypothetical protein
MKRSWVVVAAVVLAVVLVVVLLARRGDAPAGSAEAPATLAARLYQNDSLGVRLRIPETPGWTLQQDVPGADGRVATATHSDGTATVRLLVLPADETTTVQGVFAARQRQIAASFNLDSMDKLVAQEIQNQSQEVAGRVHHQWQAVTNPIQAPGEEPARVVFMWLVTATPRHSYECIGLVRIPATPDEAAQARADALLRDVAYILQSFELR